MTTALTGPVGLGVYLYMTDADDEGATGIIGELPWPGPPALEQVFYDKTHKRSMPASTTRTWRLRNASACSTC